MAQMLLVNPDGCLLNLLCEVLAEEGYIMIVADNDYEGLKHPQEQRVDVAALGTVYLVIL